MLTELQQKFPIQPIIDQVFAIDFDKTLNLNAPTGEFFNDPWTTLDQYKDTPLGKVLDSLENIGQARLLKLQSGESYTAHTDPDDRIHLPIITNEYSFLVDITNNHLYHLPANGNLWYMDTSRTHVAANWGPRPRIHLNIRVLLPRINDNHPKLRVKVVDGDFDWKQDSYIEIMGFINQQVKASNVTGFKGVSNRELLLNVLHPEIFDTIFARIRSRGVVLSCELE
jgi:hypothetical protein